MRKLAALVLAGTVSLCSSSTFAQMPSSKGSGAISDWTLLNLTTRTHSFDPILTTYIKIPQAKELVFDVALECGLYTDTLVRSKGGDKDTSTASAGIDVHVKLEKILGFDDSGDPIIDPGESPIYAYPGDADTGVTYCMREQQLMAKFQGIFQKCVQWETVADPDTGEVTEECVDYGTDTCLIVTGEDSNSDGIADNWVTTIDEECLDYEEVQLVLNTLNANAFNFISPNLDQGEYKVTVEAEISSDIDFTNGAAEAKGIIGRGSMVVDEVRYIKGDTGDDK